MRILQYLAAAALSVGILHCTAASQNDYGGLAKGSGSKTSPAGDDDDATSTPAPDAGPAPKPDPVLAFSRPT